MIPDFYIPLFLLVLIDIYSISQKIKAATFAQISWSIIRLQGPFVVKLPAPRNEALLIV